ncbi:malate synthase A [Pseudokordiimonas caeni]|uniref:malate synthase A n=1 Tax=Pseudokordiimonas caeni TaxID=2997908 RepID=UPI0028122444|nr:malate synthase A [Pseudokordiimonas caeni]
MTASTLQKSAPLSLTITGKADERTARVLTADAVAFIADLEARFGARRARLIEARTERQKRFDAGELPDFLPETADIRNKPWTILGTPADLKDRRVEITGPVDRKMMINAFNSGANVFMADFEDASAPTWDNMIDGQINLMDYADGKLTFDDPSNGKSYALGEKTAVLKVRPRGLHMLEAHAELDGQPISASFFDFGLYAFHSAAKLLARGTGAYFYLPKLESHKEAALWDEVFAYTEAALGIPHGSLKATILIETLPAAFEMDEILHAMKDHIVGLNCGRWDYIFSYIKRIGKNPAYLLPDRAEVTMGQAFLRAYSLLLIKTCHKRGAHAMGGMAAQIPVKNDEAANEAAFNKVRADKEREAANGHDGTWVAHPALVPVALEVFNKLMPQANQIIRKREDVTITAADLLEPHQGKATEKGLRENIRVGVQYIEAWLQGKGAVPLYNLMEDAATAEISRTQIWQQLYHGAKLDDGRTVDRALVQSLYDSEMAGLREALGAETLEKGRFAEAGKLFLDLVFADELAEFLTTPAYGLIQ